MSVIFVTDEPNDADLGPLIGPLARVVPMEYGDAAFFGKWEGGESISICGDRKKLNAGYKVRGVATGRSDMIQCILETGRHIQQIQDAYEAGYKFQFLIVEGIFRPNPSTGTLEVRSGNKWVVTTPQVEYSRVDDYFNQISYYLNIMVKFSASPKETARIILDLYRMFQKPPEDHHTLLRFHQPPESYAQLMERPSMLRRIAKELPNVDWVRSKAIEDHFGTLQEFSRVLALTDDREKSKILRQVPGIGKVIADNIVADSKQDYRKN